MNIFVFVWQTSHLLFASLSSGTTCIGNIYSLEQPCASRIPSRIIVEHVFHLLKSFLYSIKCQTLTAKFAFLRLLTSLDSLQCWQCLIIPHVFVLHYNFWRDKIFITSVYNHMCKRSVGLSDCVYLLQLLRCKKWGLKPQLTHCAQMRTMRLSYFLRRKDKS